MKRRVCVCCFNSTMVRLKYFSGDALSAFVGFQFHYGSIKIESHPFFINSEDMFQFHYGSIKIMRMIYIITSRSRFNSTMVRLKSFELLELVPNDDVFQFHYGSIKIYRKIFKLLLCSCFNSTMVRLKWKVNHVLKTL